MAWWKLSGEEAGKRVRNRETVFSTIVAQVDADWQRDKRNELEYEFSNGRQFRGNPARRGAYSDG